MENLILDLDANFKKWAVYYLCISPKFYKKIGHALTEEHFSEEQFKWMVRAVKTIVFDSGAPPDSESIVLQRLRNWHTQGQLKYAFLESFVDLFEFCEDAESKPNLDFVINELVPLLKKQMHYGAIKTALDSYAQNKDMGAVVSAITKADTLGVSEETQGVQFNASNMLRVLKSKTLARMPTGVDELDFVIDGGLPRGALGCAVGGAGDGKSMFLYQIGAVGLARGCHVAIATLENPEAVVFSRLVSALTNVPLAEVSVGSTLAFRRMEELENILGIGSIREFTAKATTPSEIFAWVDELGAANSRPVDLLVVDYADKLNAPKERDEYNAMRVVYEELRVGVHERKMWGWTASQSQRKNKKSQSERTDLTDVADSINKARIVDLMIGLHVHDPQEGVTDREVELFVAKYRLGASRMNVGPLATEFEFGKLTGSGVLDSVYRKVAHIV